MFHFRTLLGTTHAVSTRQGGVSRAPYNTLNVGYGTADDEAAVAENRRRLLNSLAILPADVVAARLSHGNDVSVFRNVAPRDWPVEPRPVRAGSNRRETFFDSDGVVSDVPGLHFLLTFADCVPLLFHDPVLGVLGAAHAGWRGTAAGIGREVVGVMSGRFGSEPKNIRAGIGPCIGVCCYEVGRDVEDAFRRSGHPALLEARRQKTFLDLEGTNENQLREAGVGSVERAGTCTACSTDLYFSHRAESGTTGRFALVAGLPLS